MGRVAEKPKLGVCDKQMCRPACASTQTVQRLFYLLSRKDKSKTCCMQRVNALASLSSRAD